MPRPDVGDNLAERQVAWDNMNRVALEKLWFYVTVRVDDMVTQGEDITAREYFRRLDGLFLRTGAGSVSSLNSISTRRGSFRMACQVRWNLCTV